jgi:hypothetical protein
MQSAELLDDTPRLLSPPLLLLLLLLHAQCLLQPGCMLIQP